MAGLIVGRCYEEGYGLCYVEHITGETFRLIPSSGQNRLLRQRDQIMWRKAKTKKVSTR